MNVIDTKKQNQHLIEQLNNQGFDGNKVWRSYIEQRQRCKERVDANKQPIYFRLTFQQWLDYWLQPYESGQPYLVNRGTRTHKFVMSRVNDQGHYEVGNVFINTVSANHIEAMSGKRKSQEHKDKIAETLSGEKHPRARAIIYQGIKYDYINAAAIATGVPKTTIRFHLLSSKHPECYYV